MSGDDNKASKNPYESPKTLNGYIIPANTPRTRAEEWLIDRAMLLLCGCIVYAVIMVVEMFAAFFVPR